MLQGTDSRGQWRSGVLEQSWRIGGASTAEIVAMEALHADPSLNFVRAHCVETYGKDVAIPAAATVFFAGFDEHVGDITKYALIDQ